MPESAHLWHQVRESAQLAAGPMDPLDDPHLLQDLGQFSAINFELNRESQCPYLAIDVQSRRLSSQPPVPLEGAGVVVAGAAVPPLAFSGSGRGVTRPAAIIDSPDLFVVSSSQGYVVQ